MIRGKALALLPLLFVLAGCGGGEQARGCTTTGPFGSGREQVWLLRPDGEPRSIVLFAHGWTAVDPDDWHRARLDHLCDEGSIVVFPRYQADDLDLFEQGAEGFRAGVRTAFGQLATEGIRLPVVAAGYSFGGALVSHYAGEASAWGVPAPESVLAIFPTVRVAGRPTGSPPALTRFVVLAGDRDTVVGTAGAQDLRAWVEAAGGRVEYRLVRSSNELEAHHEALKETTDAATRTFWQPLDELVSDAQELP